MDSSLVRHTLQFGPYQPIWDKGILDVDLAEIWQQLHSTKEILTTDYLRNKFIGMYKPVDCAPVIELEILGSWCDAEGILTSSTAG